MPNIDNIMVNL